MAGTRIKGSQIKKGGTKASQNATTVHCAVDVEEGDLLCVTGMSGDFMSVSLTDPNADPPQLGPFYVADYAAKAGYIGPVAVDEKIVTADTASHTRSIGSEVAMHRTNDGKFKVGGTGSSATSTGAPLSRYGPGCGRIIALGVDDGKVLLSPGRMSDCVIGNIFADSGTTLTATVPNNASYNNAWVEASFSMNPNNLTVLTATCVSGTLTITLSGTMTGTTVVRYMMFV